MSRFRNFSRRATADLDDTVGWLLDRGGAAAADRPELLPDPYRFWSIPRWRLLLVFDPTTNPATLPPPLADLRDPPDATAG